MLIGLIPSEQLMVDGKAAQPDIFVAAPFQNDEPGFRKGGNDAACQAVKKINRIPPGFGLRQFLQLGQVTGAQKVFSGFQIIQRRILHFPEGMLPCLPDKAPVNISAAMLFEKCFRGLASGGRFDAQKLKAAPHVGFHRTGIVGIRQILQFFQKHLRFHVCRSHRWRSANALLN